MADFLKSSWGGKKIYVPIFLCVLQWPVVGRDSAVGIAPPYRPDGSGIASRWGRDFPHPVQTEPGAYPASCTMGIGSFPGVTRPGRGVDHPPYLAPTLKKE